MASKRESIRENRFDTFKAIAGMRNVSTRFRTIGQVNKSMMPYCILLSGDEERERADSCKNTDCEWEMPIFLYVESEKDIETWIEKIRVANNADRYCGNYARDCYLKGVYTDTIVKGQHTRGIILIMLCVEYRVKDN